VRRGVATQGDRRPYTAEIADRQRLRDRTVKSHSQPNPEVDHGNGFVLYIEVQIEGRNNLGNGNAAVCNNSLRALGGVPTVDPPDFSALQFASDALNAASSSLPMRARPCSLYVGQRRDHVFGR